MPDQGIKSRPVYDRLRIDRSGLRHLLVADTTSFPDGDLSSEEEALEIWTVASRENAGVSPQSANPNRRSFRSARQLLDRLAHRLRDERMGFRLYAAGQEAFLWDVHGTAQASGLGRQEVFLTHHGSLNRRVLCVHCRTFNEGVTTTIAQCEGCGAQLFVRDHFSRRHSAFMGVKVDAELPGEVPSAEQAYP